ncbi:hypothetical protein GIB67_041523 [Kingdonia uniflora]|uniref:Uncharacterized protein n=1 Tax=Kingdonia uniflora TaxID=39325 RepID=A0A7J7MQL2_9MAGN|nr:hypothetical protein GIB67_041523 [Kingdonia uniflora]
MRQTLKMDVSISPFGLFRIKTRTIRNKNTTRWTDSITELSFYSIYCEIPIY